MYFKTPVRDGKIQLKMKNKLEKKKQELINLLNDTENTVRWI